ncbi:hypothetical protein DNU06_17150 [Putridiphycobacter roseus]|uniref:Outer membrane protein beta-barrel domain-containing protein n=1 Tax=Putridiphycobacter roseus TaxID=2219161 RepID=A0A2W1MU60_9FLAO|nr:hypothetical protein [Putridiphycobacter roseus]PZE15619.1 hypothetical protein DNU06_17150 [Putridiphycobacter roseus]
MIKLFLIVVIYITASTVAYAQEGDVKLSKKEKRYIHPKSRYLCFSSGWGFTSTIIKDPNDFLDQGIIQGNNSFVPSFTYEHGISNSFFIEVGYARIDQGIRYTRSVGELSSSSYSSSYQNHDIQIGGGYRIINQNNLNFFNVHTGFFIGFANKKISELQQIYGFNETDSYTGLKYEINVNINSFKSVAFGPYLGISKELRLSKDVRLFAKYIYRFGLIPILKGEFHLTSDEIDFLQEPATFKVTSGGAFVTFGLKIGLFNNKLN